jgi:hypothetical protein
MEATEALTEEMSALAAALKDDPDPDVEELTEETVEAEEADPRASGITQHSLRCRQGLGNAYAYDRSTFKPPSTGEMYTRTAFYNANGVRLLLTGWRYKGSANPYASYGNQWTYRNPAVARSLAIWWMSTGYQWSNWARCS